MVKSIYKKILIATLLITIFLVIISYNNKCFALGDVVKDSYWNMWEPKVEGSSEIEERSNMILSIIRNIGILVSVGSVGVIGIKFMLGSVEEKAQYKQRMMPWIIGATMVFAITTIPSIIYELTETTINNNATGASNTGNEVMDKLKGYDDAINEVNNLLKNNKIKDNEYTYFWEELTDKIDYLKKQYGGNAPYYNGYVEALETVLSIIKDETKGVAIPVIAKLPKLTLYVEEYIEVIADINRSIHRPDNIIKEIIEVITEKGTAGDGKKDRLVSQCEVWNEEGKISNGEKDYVKAYDEVIEKYDFILKNQFMERTGLGKDTQYVYNIKGFNEYVKDAMTSIMNDKIAGEFSKKYKYWNGYRLALNKIKGVTDNESKNILEYIRGYTDTKAKLENGEVNIENYKQEKTEINQEREKNDRVVNSKYYEGKMRRLELQISIWEE